MCLQLSHTFHAVKDLFFSAELTGIYKCKPQFKELHKFHWTMLDSHTIRAAEYCILQNPKPGSWKVARNNLSETVVILQSGLSVFCVGYLSEFYCRIFGICKRPEVWFLSALTSDFVSNVNDYFLFSSSFVFPLLYGELYRSIQLILYSLQLFSTLVRNKTLAYLHRLNSCYTISFSKGRSLLSLLELHVNSCGC